MNRYPTELLDPNEYDDDWSQTHSKDAALLGGCVQELAPMQVELVRGRSAGARGAVLRKTDHDTDLPQLVGGPTSAKNSAGCTVHAVGAFS